MSFIASLIGSVTYSKRHNDDDFSYRLSYCYTRALFFFFAIIVTTEHYVGEAISCWAPAHFTQNQVEYTNDYCWVRSTYYLPYDEYVPKEDEKRNMIPYYQWVPLILLVQALLYYMPITVWRAMTSHSGIDVSNIVVAAQTFADLQMVERREQTLRFMTKQMDRCCF